MFYVTPWGQAAKVLMIAEGVAHVELEQGGGGIMFSRGAAERYLSPAALKRAAIADDHVCFNNENLLIPILDAKELRLQFRATYPSFERNPTEADLDANLVKRLSEFNRDYLQEVGFRPNIDFVDRRSLQLGYEQAVRNGHPSVVSTVEGDHATLLPGLVEVRTADGQAHLVTERSFQAMEANEVSRITKPISALVLVNEGSYPAFQNRLLNYGKVLAETYGRQIEEGTESARRELVGNHWGPRQTFSHLLSDAVSRVENYAREHGIEPIRPIIQSQLEEIYRHAHPELQGAYSFSNFLWEPEPKLGPQLLAQAEGGWSAQRQEKSLTERDSLTIREPAL